MNTITKKDKMKKLYHITREYPVIQKESITIEANSKEDAQAQLDAHIKEQGHGSSDWLGLDWYLDEAWFNEGTEEDYDSTTYHIAVKQ